MISQVIYCGRVCFVIILYQFACPTAFTLSNFITNVTDSDVPFGFHKSPTHFVWNRVSRSLNKRTLLIVANKRTLAGVNPSFSYKPFPAGCQHLKVSQITCHFSQLIFCCLDLVELGSINIKRDSIYKLRNRSFKIPCWKRSPMAYLAC